MEEGRDASRSSRCRSLIWRSLLVQSHPLGRRRQDEWGGGAQILRDEVSIKKKGKSEGSFQILVDINHSDQGKLYFGKHMMWVWRIVEK